MKRKMADSRRRYNSYKNAKRRADAISFLSNISLSGRSERGGHGRSRRRSIIQNSSENDESKEEGFTLKTTVTVRTKQTEGNEPCRTSKNTNFTPSQWRASPSTTFSGKHRASLTILHHIENNVTETPTSVLSTSKIRKSFSSSRTRRTSGASGGVTPPSSPTKGSERFFVNRSFSSDPRFSRHVPSDQLLHWSPQGSSEELLQVITARKISSLESPPELTELGFSRTPLSSQLYSDGSRVVLVSNHKAPIAIWSHLRYNRTSQYGIPRKDFEAIVRTRAGSVVSRPRNVPDESPQGLSFLEGILLAGEGKTVSYSHMLVPTLNLTAQSIRRITITENVLGTSPVAAGLTERDGESVIDLVGQYQVYDPKRLDDPELISGKHKKLFEFASYRVSVIDYAKPSALKRDINEKFKARFPRIEITLSKLRSIKREMKNIILDKCELDPVVLAHAYVYFEKLVLYEKINKENRKLLAGVCLILSAKMNDIKGTEMETLVKEIEDTFRENKKDLFAFEFPVLVALEFALHIPVHEEIEDTFRENKKDLFAFEFPVLVALEFALHIPVHEVMPHYLRLIQT